jgi:hypothetical protein
MIHDIQAPVADWAAKGLSVCRLTHKPLQRYAPNLDAHPVNYFFHLPHAGSLAEGYDSLLEQPVCHIAFGHEKTSFFC